MEKATDLEFLPMESFPKDGTRCAIKFIHGTVVFGFFWGRRLIGPGYCIRGEQNELSPWLVPVGWAIEPSKGDTE